IALAGAFTAKMEEDRQRRIAEKARKAAEAERLNILNYQAVQERIREIARAREEAKRKREEARRKKASRHPLQDLWDRNGAAIYDANQQFKTDHGRDMSARDRRKAIKDATVGGVFSAGAYVGSIEQAWRDEEAKRTAALRAQNKAVLDEKRRRREEQLTQEAELEKERAMQAQKDGELDSATRSYMAMAAAAEAGKFDKEDYDTAREQAENNALQRGLRAYYEGRKAGEEKTPTPWWSPVTTPVVSAWNDSKRIISNAWKDVKEAPSKLSKLWDDTKKWTSTFWDETKEVFKNVKENIWDTPKKIIDNAWNDIKEWTNETIQSVKQTLDVVKEQAIDLGKEAIAWPINKAADLAYYGAYLPYSDWVQNHPDAHQRISEQINNGLEPLKNFVSQRTNTTDLDTMTWTDIGKTWLFELNSDYFQINDEGRPALSFGPETHTTQEIMQLEGVQELRRIAVEDIVNGNGIDTEPKCEGPHHCYGWIYNVPEYFSSLIYHVPQGNLARVYLGSYRTNVNIYPNPDGTYQLEYSLENDSSLDSFTRFRRDKTGFWPQSATRGEGIEIGGTINMRFHWSETYDPAIGEVLP
ncbi:hypothetical protein DRJ25_06050, partial [Candidatus Woesearchaeota archaeon]